MEKRIEVSSTPTKEDFSHAYQTIKEILSELYREKPNDELKVKILAEIDRAFGPSWRVPLHPPEACYVYIAIFNCDANILDVFKNIFYERIAKNPLDLTMLALMAHGVEDLPNILAPEKTDNAGDPFTFKLLWEIYDAARYDSAVIISGATGTSKEGVAKAIHFLSPRRNADLISVNCTTFSDGMFRAEFFGHKKGSFTGAIADRRGLIEAANGSYIFLDELGEMPKSQQVKLLRVLDEKKVTHIGENIPIPVNVRVIAALHPNHLEPDENGNYKIMPDLLHRLGKPEVIHLPSLNERMNARGDGSVNAVLTSVSNALKREWEGKVLPVHQSCYPLLLSYTYESGNYRELRGFYRSANKIALRRNRLVIMPDDFELLREHIKNDSGVTKCEPEKSYRHIPLKDILTHADAVAVDIINAKFQELKNDGEQFETVLKKEGLMIDKDRDKYLKMCKRRTGKAIRDYQPISKASNL